MTDLPADLKAKRDEIAELVSDTDSSTYINGFDDCYAEMKEREAKHLTMIGLQDLKIDILKEREKDLQFKLDRNADDFRKFNLHIIKLKEREKEYEARLAQWESEDLHEAMTCHRSNEEFDALKERNRVLVEALEWYSGKFDRNKYHIVTTDNCYLSDLADWGEVARECLKETSSEKD